MNSAGPSRLFWKRAAAFALAAVLCAVLWRTKTSELTIAESEKGVAAPAAARKGQGGAAGMVEANTDVAATNRFVESRDALAMGKATDPLVAPGNPAANSVANIRSSPPSPEVSKTFSATGSAAEDNSNYPPGTQPNIRPPADHRSSAEILESWGQATVEAEAVEEDVDSTDAAEAESLQVISANDGGDAMTRLLRAFQKEPDPERRQDLLAAAQGLAEKGQSPRALLVAAFDSSQPVEVQRQALYLATHFDVEIAKQVAANPKNPLHLDAEAFVLEDRIATGTPTEATDD